MTDYEFSHTAKQRKLEQLATEWVARHSDLTPAVAANERSIDPANLTLISDARQSRGCETLMMESRWFEDEAIDDNRDEGDLHPLERRVEAQHRRMRERIELRGYFENDLLKLCGSEEERTARVQRSFRLLKRTAAEDIRAAIAATIDEDLASLHYSFKQRRDAIARAMGCSVATANERIARGLRVLQTAIRMASVDQSHSEAAGAPVAAAPKRLKPNLRNATRGTQFDSEARRVAIATLSPDEQEAFVRVLERQAVEGEVDAIDKKDRADRIRMLPHCFNQVLDDVGRSDDASRRLLARLTPEERKRLCIDWMREAVDFAIGGTTDQRKAARDKHNSREYAEMVRRFVKQNVGAN